MKPSFSDYRRLCPLIRDDIIKGMKIANGILDYNSEEPQISFFCPHDDSLSDCDSSSTASYYSISETMQDTEPTSIPSSSNANPLSSIGDTNTHAQPSLPQRHIATKVELGEQLQCSQHASVYSQLTEKHRVWLFPVEGEDLINNAQMYRSL